MRPTAGAGGTRFNARWLVMGVIGAILVWAVAKGHHISSDEILFFVVLVPSIILHEVSHGWAALAFGDDTARRAGRLSLNPLKHIDPIGTIILPIILILSPLHSAFGYAKPVPVNVRQLRNPRNQALLVGLAGPAVNIAIAVLSGLLLRLYGPVQELRAGILPSSLLWEAIFLLGFANVLLAAFNLIPLPPLDGSAVLERVMPRSWWPTYLRGRPYALPALVLVIIFLPGVFDTAENWAISQWARLLG